MKTETAESEVETATAEQAAPNAIPEAVENVINAGCPTVQGLTRKTHLLFAASSASYFRVNFHDKENANTVIKSAFVVIKDGAAVVEWEVSGLGRG